MTWREIEPTSPLTVLTQDLVPSAGIRGASDRAQAIRRSGRNAAAPPLALPAQRAAMGVRLPGLWIIVRVSRWVAEEVVDELHPGAHAVG